MASLANWQPYKDHIQSGMKDGRFMSGAYTVIAAGPPRLAQVGSNVINAAENTADAAILGAQGGLLAYPIGIVQNFSQSQNTQISQIFELGSVRSYFIPGRSVGQLQLSRIMYHGPSLLRALYAVYPSMLGNLGTTAESLLGGVLAKVPGDDKNTHTVKNAPGFENLYLNLASDLFTQPIGLLMMLKDSNESTIGATYFESCYVPNHTLQMDAQGTIIQESVAIQYERAIPIAISEVGIAEFATKETGARLATALSGTLV
jgi:hypothetical protein